MEATAGGWMKKQTKQTKSLFANAANKKPGAAGGGTPSAEPSYKRDALSMYQVPPQGEVTIEQFERFAMDRLRGVYMMGWARDTVWNGTGVAYARLFERGVGASQSRCSHMPHLLHRCRLHLSTASAQGHRRGASQGLAWR